MYCVDITEVIWL